MSFSYKTLNSNDITLTSYIANKQWEANSSSLSQNGVTIYVGENSPVTKDNPFNPIDDNQTSNDEYRRLVFDSIKHLYYENYTSASLTGQFFNSSSYFNYEQSTLVSGTIRNLTTITGSNLNPGQPVLYDNPTSQSVFDSVSTVYDLDTIDPDAGSRVVVISIDKSIYGSGLSPKSVNISGSTYNIQDDGEGNLLDTLTSKYIGNVFYSQGLIVITNQNYLCVLGIPPTAVNDYFSYNNTTPNSSLDILGNDFVDCGFMDFNSFISTGGNFPNYTQNNGIITITPDQASVIPGNYQLGYTIASTTGIRSNTGSINLTITSQPLEIFDIISSYTCYGTSSLIPVTCSIDYGIPYYSWSFDGGINYSSSNSLTSITVSGSISSSANSIIYVKDYTGTIYSSSFTSQYSPILPATGYPYYETPLCSSTASNGVIYIKRGESGQQASVNGGAFTFLSKFDPGTAFTNATTASTIIYKNAAGCTTSSIFNMNYLPSLVVNFSTSSTSCYGGINGTATFAITNSIGGNYKFYENSTLISSSYLSSPTSSITFNNLRPTYTYDFELSSSTNCNSQYYNKSFTIGQPTQISFSATASFINSCSNAVIFNAIGGAPPYTYFAVDTGSGVTYSSDSSSVSLTSLSGSTYSLSILDSKGCTSPSSSLTVFGRQYEYTGSVCSGSTGYVSSSGIQQNFISGPYSGSKVTSSYSNGTILYGPTIDFKQLFISGVLETITPCRIGGATFTQTSYNPVLCPPGGCTIPILTQATPSNCNNFNGKYDVYYNSGSTTAIFTYIQYSTSPTFSSNVTASRITNFFPSTLPINVNNLPSPPSSYFTSVYFRAYNSCSSGLGTSSFSNVIEANCSTPPPPTYSPFAVYIKNKSTVGIRYQFINQDVVTVPNNNTSGRNFSTQATSLKITLSSTPITLNPNGNGTYDYTLNISSSNAVNCFVSTTVTPLLPNTPYTPTTVNCGYINGGTSVGFDADATALAYTYDVQVDIDRGTYTPGGSITLTIEPNDLNQ